MRLKLGELFEIRTGYTFRDSIYDLDKGDTAVIQAGDINAARIGDAVRVQFSGDKHLLQPDDIVISSRGATVARTVTSDLLPAVAASSVIVLRPLAGMAISWYVASFLNSSAGQAALNKIMSGAYIKTLRKSELQEISVPLPSLMTQRTLVEFGAALDQYRLLLNRKERLFRQAYDQAINQGGDIS